jgi:hypothetical protein
MYVYTGPPDEHGAGTLLTGPTHSPENSFELKQGQKEYWQVSSNPKP